MTAETEIQKLDQDAIIELFQVDLSDFGEATLLFTPHIMEEGRAIVFGPNFYASIAVKSEGFAWSGTGAKISPTLTLARRNPSLLMLLSDYDNLAGVPITRILTYRRFLGDGDEPDGEAILSTEIFVVDRVSRPATHEIIFELATPMDQARVRLPGRLIVRDHCTFEYRTWDAARGRFDYTHVFCPYTGLNYFDTNGNPVNSAALDQCSRQLETGCEKRFPAPSNVPFGGFPGVARFRG